MAWCGGLERAGSVARGFKEGAPGLEGSMVLSLGKESTSKLRVGSGDISLGIPKELHPDGS
jgi:hypothetical protein